MTIVAALVGILLGYAVSFLYQVIFSDFQLRAVQWVFKIGASSLLFGPWGAISGRRVAREQENKRQRLWGAGPESVTHPDKSDNYQNRKEPHF